MHCTQCGRENPNEYRFCGICGRALRPASNAPSFRQSDVDSSGEPLTLSTERLVRSATSVFEVPMREKLPSYQGEDRPHEPSSGTTISGPSFLGLDNQSAPEYSYLLEDDSSSHPARKLFAFVVILAIAAGGWWEIRQHGGQAWVMSMLGRAQSGQGVKQEGVPADRLNRSNAALAESATNPNASKEADLQVQNGALVPKPGESMDLGKKAAEVNPVGPEGADSSAANSSQQGSPAAKGQPSQSTQENSKVNAEEAARKQQNENQPAASEAPPVTNTEQAVRKQGPAENGPTGGKRVSHSGSEQAALRASDRTTTSPAEDDGTTRVAEKYLYGQGVPQDCNRAVALLRPAADASNAKARTMLGTMYATGHCVARDLPSSYHWFALALRQEPNNPWLSKNLSTVWNQMNDSQKQLAMRMTK